MSRSRSRALASVRIRVEDGVDNLSVEAEKEWLRDADEQSLRHPRPYARLEGIPHIEHSIPLDGINYSSRILTRGERDPDLTLEVARFADSPVR